MLAKICINNKEYTCNLNEGIDISIPISHGEDNLAAWYIPKPNISPVKTENWTGSVKAGNSVNFNNIQFNPHAHGTHTECIGHITKEFYNVSEELKNHFFICEIVSIQPSKKEEDWVITKKDILQLKLKTKAQQAIAIRTLPNNNSKKNKNYNHSSWTYINQEAMEHIVDLGIEHLLIDTPSVDKEKDNGQLLAHKAFWNYPKLNRKHCSITEFIYIDDAIEDGTYLLNLQVAPFNNDASPSRPVLYRLKN